MIPLHKGLSSSRTWTVLAAGRWAEPRRKIWGAEGTGEIDVGRGMLTWLSQGGVRRCVWRKVGTKGVFMGIFINLNLSPPSQAMPTSCSLKLELHFNPKQEHSPLPGDPVTHVPPLLQLVFHKAAQTRGSDPTHWYRLPQLSTAPSPAVLRLSSHWLSQR